MNADEISKLLMKEQSAWLNGEQAVELDVGVSSEADDGIR